MDSNLQEILQSIRQTKTDVKYLLFVANYFNLLIQKVNELAIKNPNADSLIEAQKEWSVIIRAISLALGSFYVDDFEAVREEMR